MALGHMTISSINHSYLNVFAVLMVVFIFVLNLDINEPPGSPCIGTNWEVSEAAASGTPVTNPLMANDTDPGQVSNCACGD